MELSNKELKSLDRHSAAMEMYAEAAKSSAGKEMRKERIDLEKVVGGKAKLDKADKILADAEVTVRALLSQGTADAKDLVEAAASGVASESRRLNEANRIAAQTHTEAAGVKKANVAKAGELTEREKNVSEREGVVDGDTLVNVDVSAHLDQRAARLDARERDLDARSDRLKAAMA